MQIKIFGAKRVQKATFFALGTPKINILLEEQKQPL